METLTLFYFGGEGGDCTKRSIPSPSLYNGSCPCFLRGEFGCNRIIDRFIEQDLKFESFGNLGLNYTIVETRFFNDLIFIPHSPVHFKPKFPNNSNFKFCSMKRSIIRLHPNSPLKKQ